MKFIGTIARELLGLFVDDGSLAIGVLAWVGLVAALLESGVASPALCGPLFVAGLAALLIENVWRTARK